MPAKIRLQRFGKKRNAFYHIVIADGRAPRDGRFIEKIGTYNPNTNPASIELNFEKALSWVKTGAQPTDTVRAILSYEGVLYKNHLDIGVKKGAFTDADADKKFSAWKKGKLDKIQQKIEKIGKADAEAVKSKFNAEEEVSKKRENAILAKTSALAEEAAKANAAAEASSEEAKVEAPAEEAKTEAPAEEAKAEAPAEEVKAEAPTEEVKAEAETPEETKEAPKANDEEKAEEKEA